MLEAAIDTFFEHYAKSFDTLITPHDAQWPSPCEVGKPWQDAQGAWWTEWAPVRRHATAEDFAGLETALEMPIHPDIKTHYGRYWLISSTPPCSSTIPRLPFCTNELREEGILSCEKVRNRGEKPNRPKDLIKFQQ